MNRKRALSDAIKSANIAVNRLLDLRDDLKQDLKTLLKVSNAEEVEAIQDEEIRRLARSYQQEIEIIFLKADKLNDLIAELEEEIDINF